MHHFAGQELTFFFKSLSASVETKNGTKTCIMKNLKKM